MFEVEIANCLAKNAACRREFGRPCKHNIAIDWDWDYFPANDKWRCRGIYTSSLLKVVIAALISKTTTDDPVDLKPVTHWSNTL